MARKPTYEELKQRVKELENESLAHKETGKALRASEEKMAGIMSSITDHMSMMDDKHNIVWANNVAKKLFGTDLVGKKCYRAYHGYDSPCESCVVRKCFEDGEVHEHETVATSFGVRRCGVRFGMLTENHTAQLEYFIKTHATGVLS